MFLKVYINRKVYLFQFMVASCVCLPSGFESFYSYILVISMLLIKSIHIISIVTWFAGLFYLPRLFVYHADTHDDEGKKRFCIMERRLYKGIMNPSIAVVFLTGIALLSFNGSYYSQAFWLYLKLMFVILLLLFHVSCGRNLRLFAQEANTKSSKYFRWYNEVPTIALIAIILLVELQPAFAIH